jgi:uncharacterized membrane protein YkvA (DUF1232 family)
VDGTAGADYPPAVREANPDGTIMSSETPPDDEAEGQRGESARLEPEEPDAPASDKERWRQLATFVPRLVQLVWRLLADPEVPLLDKILLGAAAAYAASPFDIVPDFVPLLGQIDDIYLIAICLLRLMHRSGEAKLRQHWEGPEDIVQLLHTVTDVATRILPGGLRERLRHWVEAGPQAPV